MRVSTGPLLPLGLNRRFLSKPGPRTAPTGTPIGPPSAVTIADSTRVAINHPPHPDHWPGAFPRHSHHTPQPRMRMDEPLAGKDHHMKLPHTRLHQHDVTRHHTADSPQPRSSQPVIKLLDPPTPQSIAVWRLPLVPAPPRPPRHQPATHHPHHPHPPPPP